MLSTGPISALPWRGLICKIRLTFASCLPSWLQTWCHNWSLQSNKSSSISSAADLPAVASLFGRSNIPPDMSQILQQKLSSSLLQSVKPVFKKNHVSTFPACAEDQAMDLCTLSEAKLLCILQTRQDNRREGPLLWDVEHWHQLNEINTLISVDWACSNLLEPAQIDKGLRYIILALRMIF